MYEENRRWISAPTVYSSLLCGPAASALRQPCRRSSQHLAPSLRENGGGRGIPQWLNMAWGCGARPESLSRCLAAQAASLIHHRCLIRAAGRRLRSNYTCSFFPPSSRFKPDFNLKRSPIESFVLEFNKRLNALEFETRSGT